MQTEMFDHDPPAQRHSPTSVAAAEAIKGKAVSLRQAVLNFLREQGDLGATDEEMQGRLQMPGNTQRARRVELMKMGLVMYSARTRKTKSGRDAAVWIAT